MGLIQSVTADLYKDVLLQLHPKGALFENVAQWWVEFWDAAAQEFERVEDFTVALVGAMIPQIAPEFTGLLPEWEATVGIPNECIPTVATLDVDRQTDIIAKLNAKGDMSETFFIALALTYGFAATITKTYLPFTAGSVAGDSLTNSAWTYAWTMTMPAAAASTPLPCLVTKWKPAHSTVIFYYT